MSLTGAAIRLLASRGLSADDIADVAEANEQCVRSKAAERQARYRKRKAESVTSDVTRDATPPPKSISNPHSVSDETGEPPVDPVKLMFDLGVEMLVSQGHTEKQARSLVGSWRKGRAPGDVAAALIDARTRAISNLVEWMPKRLGSNGDPPSYLDQYLSEQRAA